MKIPPRDAGSDAPTTVTYTYEDTRRDSGEVVPPSTGVVPAPRQGVMDRSSDTREHIIGVSPWDTAEPADIPEMMPARG